MSEERISHLAAGLVSGSPNRNDKHRSAGSTPLQSTLARLRGRPTWLVGDTPEAIRAARAAAVLPIGFAALDDDSLALRPTLEKAGAARILETLDEIAELAKLEG
jgi:phosphoglycolate phosphatase-like HAD superfamily hydrolase